MRYLLVLTAALGMLFPAPAARGQGRPEQRVDYQKDIQPILAQNCYGCHSEVKIKSGLRVDSLAEILKGGLNGPAIVPGKSGQSLLVRKADPEDPTPHKGRVLGPAQLALVKAWVDQAAPAKPGVLEVDLNQLPPDLARQIREELARQQAATPKK